MACAGTGGRFIGDPKGSDMAKNKNPDINSTKVTERIEAIALDLLARNPDGLPWSELNRKIGETDSSLHPKTINGTVWKLVENYPDRVHKPEKGLFRLLG